VKVPITDDQFGALVSFDFNTGSLHKSTLLKKLNAGDYEGAANEFPKWNKAGGQVLRGLTRRRKSEQNLFLGKEDYIIPA
jgi:GH24 family phage-related lysozyme (muramidase)